MTHHEDAYDARMGESGQVASGKVATTVLHVGGLGWASEKAVVERVLGRRPGVRLVEANPVSQTATVTFDTARTSVAELRRWVEECGYHCAGQSVPSHVCDPMAEPDPVDGHGAMPAPPSAAVSAVVTAATGRAEHLPRPVPGADEPAAAASEVPAERGGRWLPGRACRLRRR
jgi:P-type Cu2+ transporter